jgi:hypothetical protein
MFYKILIVNKFESFQKLLEYLDHQSSSYDVITDNHLLNNFLKNNKKSSKLFEDIFPIFSQEDRDVKSKTTEIIKNYLDIFKNIKYSQIELFKLIQNHVIREIVLLEQTKFILNKKKNYIFIFSEISFTHFSMLKIANELNYDTSKNYVEQILLNKIEKIYPNYMNKFKDFSKKINFLKGVSKQKNVTKNNNILNKSDDHNTNQTISIKSILFNSMFNSKNKIHKNIENKILKFNKNKIDHAIFFTPSREDELLSGFLIYDEFKKNSKPLIAFSFDLLTKNLLLKKDIIFLDFSHELFFLSRVLKKSNEAKNVFNHFKQIIKKHNIPLFFENQFSPLITNLFSTMALIEILKILLQIYKFQNILVANDGNKIGNTVCNVSDNLKIPTYTVMPYSYEPDPLISLQFTAQKIFVGGEYALKILSTLGYNDKNLIITGNPIYDYVKKLNPLYEKKNLTKIGISTRKKLILVALSRWENDDEIWLSNLIKFSNLNNFELILKIHPMYKTKFQDSIKEKINYIEKHCKMFSYLITYDHDILKLISACDILITDYSSLSVDSVLNKKFLIRVNFSKKRLLIENEFFQYIPHILVENYDKLEFVLLNSNPISMDDLKSFYKNFNIFNDGQSSERIFNILTKN